MASLLRELEQREESICSLKHLLSQSQSSNSNGGGAVRDCPAPMTSPGGPPLCDSPDLPSGEVTRLQYDNAKLRLDLHHKSVWG